MRRILLDTDLAMGAPGSDIDDGFALALALADPEISLELVTTVNGNTDLDSATRLTLALLDRLGHGDIPVAPGAGQSLRGWRRPPPKAPIEAPAEVRRAPAPGHAANHLVDRVLADPGALTIVAIGPLTNVALALALEPRLAALVEEIVVMGGVFREHTNLAGMPGEFNTWADPDATATVLASGAPLRFVGLDVTRKVRLTRVHASEMSTSGGEFGRFAGACAEQWIDHMARTNPGDARDRDSCALHDPLAVAVVTTPGLVTWQDAYVQVETSSQVTRGVMIADLLTAAQPPRPNCRIAVDVDSEAFIELFLGRMSQL